MARVKLSAADLEGAEELAPAAPAAAPARVKLSAADLEGAQELDTPKPQTTSALGAGALGGARGLLAGFDDELAGGAAMANSVLSAPRVLGEKAGAAIKNLFGGHATAPELQDPREAYRQNRDAVRDLHAVAEQEHPTAHMVGDIAGGVAGAFVPGLGAAKGATLAKIIGRAAVQGGVEGAGRSDAGGDDLGQFARDTLTSAAFGGATAGVAGKFLHGSTDRVVKRALGDLTDGATAKMRDKVVGKAGKAVDGVYEEIAQNKALQAAGKDAQKALQAVQASVEDVGAKLDDQFAKAGAATPGIRVSAITDNMHRLADELAKSPGKASAAAAVRGQISDVVTAWKGRTHVTPQEVREFAKDVGDHAFAGSPAVAPKQGASVAQQVWGNMKDLIEQNIEEAAKKTEGVDVATVKKLNSRMSNLLHMRDAVQYKATREATESTRLKDRVSGGVDMVLGANALAGNFAPFVAKKAIQHVGVPLAKGADALLARAVHAAQNGSTSAQIALRAGEWGLAPGAAAQLAEYASSKFGRRGQLEPLPVDQGEPTTY